MFAYANLEVVWMSIVNGKVVIHAVHERDAEKFWKKLELKDVEDCAVCGKGVAWETVGAFGALAGKVRVCCENLHCLYVFGKLVRKEGKEG